MSRLSPFFDEVVEEGSCGVGREELVRETGCVVVDDASLVKREELWVRCQFQAQ